MKKNAKKITIFMVIAAAIALIAVYYSIGGEAPVDDSLNPLFKGQKVTVYKSPSCGCCAQYASYLKRKGFDVAVVNNDEELEKIKDTYNIPADVESCHTSIIDGYFVEGHIPVAAINKLLAEKPDIAGIGMPGMPSGSPGMPGRKLSSFYIDAVAKNGGIDSYIEL